MVQDPQVCQLSWAGENRVGFHTVSAVRQASRWVAGIWEAWQWSEDRCPGWWLRALKLAAGRQ